MTPNTLSTSSGWPQSRSRTTDQRAQYLTAEQIPMIRVGMEIGVFSTLAADLTKDWTAESLADALECDSELLYRLLRYFFSISLLRENPNMTYVATDNTVWLSTEGAQARLRSYRFDVSPSQSTFANEPSRGPFRTRSGGSHRNSQQVSLSSCNIGSSTTPAAAASNASRVSQFVQLMRSRHHEAADWLSVFPIQRILLTPQNTSHNQWLFVDVGGSTGSQSIALRQRYPQLTGRIVVQDQAAVLAQADGAQLEAHGIQTLVHDLQNPQPITSAKIYFLRHVLNEWPDHECIQILERLRDAMAPDSVLLIDEMVLPSDDSVQSTDQKWIASMMATLTTMERNETQWRHVIERAGLTIEQIARYDRELNKGLIVVSKGTFRPSQYYY